MIVDLLLKEKANLNLDDINGRVSGSGTDSDPNYDDELALPEESLESDEEVRLHILGVSSFFAQPHAGNVNDESYKINVLASVCIALHGEWDHSQTF